LERACERFERDASTVARSVGLYTVVGEDEAGLDRAWRAVTERAPIDASSVDRDAFAADTLVGTADACAARIKEFEALGVQEVICSFGIVPFSVSSEDQVELFARAVIPAVR
jgi:alkanesulfonate monooxygenase SsuD/methylene tetrahydromethanopterin reductase-like flavin-dependent oxidoreductase (luciferase family)